MPKQIRLTMACIIAAAIACLFAAFATANKAKAHDWFTDKVNPVTKNLCRNHTDCHVIPIYDLWQDGNDWVVLWDGKEWRIPQTQAQPTEDAKGRPAACIWGGQIRCVFIPLFG